MKEWGCLGSIAGALIGLLIVVFLLLLFQSVPPPPATIQPATIAPDITIFLSEQSLSRMASETIKRPTAVNFDVNGQMQVTTQANIFGLKPVVHVGLLLEMQGTEVVSQLRWVRFGFLTVPAGWLPQGVTEMVTVLGQTIKAQTPPDFTLIGLTTTPDGVNFQLKWVGQ